MTLPHSTDIWDYPARYQFGQGSAPCGGASCCTDTCIQMIVEYYKEKHYTLDEIRKVAQAKTNFNEAPCTGINYIEALNALESFGITHYRVGFGATAQDVYNKQNTGPIIVGVWYGSYPNLKGTCAPQTNVAQISGRSDCGFSGAHAVLAIDAKWVKTATVSRHDIYTRDPDHNSPARPAKPNYDRITQGQLQKAMDDLPRYSAFNTTYIIYPTRTKSL